MVEIPGTRSPHRRLLKTILTYEYALCVLPASRYLRRVQRSIAPQQYLHVYMWDGGRKDIHSPSTDSRSSSAALYFQKRMLPRRYQYTLLYYQSETVVPQQIQPVHSAYITQEDIAGLVQL